MTDHAFETVLAFDGHGDYLRIPAHPSLCLASYTISFWVRFPAKPNGWVFLYGGSQAGTKDRAHQIYIKDVGMLHHRFATSKGFNAGAPNTANGILSWARWQHITITNDGKLARTYLDGKLAAEGPVDGTFKALAFDHYLGFRLEAPGAFVRAEFAELRVFSVVHELADIQATLSQRLTGQEPNLVLYLPLDDATPRDRSPHAHAVEVHGNPRARFVDDLPIDDRRLDLQHPVLELDGAATQLLAGPLPELDTAMTIELWTKRGPKPDAVLLDAYDDAGQRVAAISLPGGGELRWDAAGEHLARGLDAYDYADAWTHWAFSKDCERGRMQIVRNGVVWAEVSGITQPLAKRIARLSVGASGGGTSPGQFWAGQLSELRIWSVARTPEQIRADMHARLHGDEANLVAYWRLDAEAGERGEDHGKHGHDARIEQPRWAHALVPMLAVEDDQIHSTGFTNYAYWWHWMSHVALEQHERVPFRRGRIWS